MQLATVGKLSLAAVLMIAAASCATTGELRAVEERVERTERRVEQLASTLATVEQRLSGIQTSIGDLSRKLDMQSSRIEEIGGSVQNLSRRITATPTREELQRPRRTKPASRPRRSR